MLEIQRPKTIVYGCRINFFLTFPTDHLAAVYTHQHQPFTIWFILIQPLILHKGSVQNNKIINS